MLSISKRFVSFEEVFLAVAHVVLSAVARVIGGFSASRTLSKTYTKKAWRASDAFSTFFAGRSQLLGKCATDHYGSVQSDRTVSRYIGSGI
jgi:hypothetical protein